MDFALLLLPLIGAVIGYVTNYLAIKMLFHPRYPIRLVGLHIQGIFPRRQADFARKLGHLVATELLSIDDLTQRLQQRANSPAFIAFLEQRIQAVLLNKVPQHYPSLVFLLGSELIGGLTSVFRDDIQRLLQELIVQLRDEMQEEVNIQQIVEQKVAGFSIERLEGIVFEVMAKEFRFVELIGAVLGFMIGLLQVGLVLWSS